MGVKANKYLSIVYIYRQPKIYQLYAYFMDEKRKQAKKQQKLKSMIIWAQKSRKIWIKEANSNKDNDKAIRCKL